MKKELFGIKVKGEKELIRFVVIAGFWILIINNISQFLGIVNNVWKFALYIIGVFITKRIIEWSLIK